MSLKPPPQLEKLQTALHAKAKSSPHQRFHALYDKVYRLDILAFAYACCQANKGAAGVDGLEFADIRKYGLDQWLGELAEELRKRTYRPNPVRRVWIPKPDGKQRPLGIPTIRDRVVQTAAMLVLGPIFEADLQSEQYAYRPDRSGLDAVQRVYRLLNSGHTQVVDADLSGYFDSIPHAELMQCLRRRIVDGAMLHLLKMWLQTPVEETDDRGNARRTTRNRDEGKGTPQGAPISPLLSNLYMRRFVLGWKTLGHAARLNAQIVNYADDFVICCRGTALQAMWLMRDMMARMKLTVNESKTHMRRVGLDPTAETFDFLGYTFGRHWAHRSQRWILCQKPSDQRVRRLCDTLSEMTDRRHTAKSEVQMATELNRVLRGWGGYFCRGPVARVYTKINSHLRLRFNQWWIAKHRKRTKGPGKHWSPWLERTYGLIPLRQSMFHQTQANA